MKKYKYIYDKKTGHIIKKLNEDDQTNQQQQTNDQSNQNTQNNTQNNQQTNNVQTTYNKSVDSNPNIQKINTQLANIKKKYNDDIAVQNKLLEAEKINASKKQIQSVYDQVLTDNNVLTIMKRINDINKKYYMDICNLEDQRINALKQLQSATESYHNIPEKYKNLNESNLHTAKIYLKNLISPENELLKGMADFKRAFKDSDLLYGKDKNGYFIIAIDSEDFNKATNTLEEVGYLKDDILDTIMPQILDRHSMIQ